MATNSSQTVYVTVPSMMPRPLLSKTFAVNYRKIPILSIGREVYCDTSIIIESLEHFFPESEGWGSVYPKVEGLDSWSYKGLVRGFASFWIDVSKRPLTSLPPDHFIINKLTHPQRPFFRATTGLIPPSVWSSTFGRDRAQLIGHPLSPSKLASKIPQNLSTLDLHLSLLEPTFRNRTGWLIPTPTPSLADISLYYQLRWGIDIAAGKGIYNLTAGGTSDTNEDVTKSVFNAERYPGVWRWFHAFEAWLATLPNRETVVAESDVSWKDELRRTPLLSDEQVLVPAAAGPHPSLDMQRGLVPGASVSVVPDDTGRDNPTEGKLVRIGVEEVVIEPVGEAEISVRIHFPRVGFVVRVLDGSRL